MFFAALFLFVLCAWLAPWWFLMPVAFALGVFSVRLPLRASGLQAALAAAVSWGTVAFIQDGRSHGLISTRISGLFGLPSPQLLFLVMALIGAVTALTGFQSGRFARRLWRLGEE